MTDRPEGSERRPNERSADQQRVIALGASAGGVEALTRVVRNLSPGLSAPILVVLHVPTTAVSRLPAILERSGGLRAEHATHGAIPQPGRIYIAPPDRHMVVTDGRLLLVEGPRENGVRPAIDPLFRSAARWYRERLIAGVLSGTMDDGTAGLAVVHELGGITIAQDPADAIAPGMPASAIENAPIDHVVAASEMAELLGRLVADGQVDPDRRPRSPQVSSTPIDIVCPDCGGVLRQFVESGVVRFHCRVGHTYSAASLYAAQDVRLEAALWAAIRSLEDTASLARRLADEARARGARLTARTFEERERIVAEHADVVRAAILSLAGIEETPPEGEVPPVAIDFANRAEALADGAETFASGAEASDEVVEG